jgi:hypothetical protein
MKAQQLNKDATQSNLEAALEALRLGHSLFPLYYPVNDGCSCGNPKCENVGKHPIPKHGQDEATTDERVVRAWWTKHPQANVGQRIPEGQISLDRDDRHGGDESLIQMQRDFDKLPETVELLTGNGVHYSFKLPPGAAPLRGKSVPGYPGLDYKTSKGYEVGAGSLHANGKRYTYEVEHHPDTMPVAIMPQWFYDLLAKQSGGVAADKGGENWVAEALKGAPDGSRDETCTRLAGHFRNLEPINVTRSILLDFASKCNPPLSAQTVEKCLQSVYKYEPLAQKQEPFDWRTVAVSHESLMRKNLPPMTFLIQDLEPKEGLTIIAGKKKLGKSFFTLQQAQCVAAGTPFLNKQTVKSKVAYLALEDGEVRLKQRLVMQSAEHNASITYHFKWPPLNSKQGWDALVEMLDEVKPGLLIIDTVAAAISGKMDQNSAGETGAFFTRLHSLALDKHVSIVLVAHHGKRPTTDDVGFDIRGSSAIPGCSDCNIGIYRDSAHNTYELKAESRDFPEVDMRLSFDRELTWCWQLEGNEQDLRRSEAERNIKDAIDELGGTADARAIADHLGITRAAVQQHVKYMRKEGKLAAQTFADKQKNCKRILYTNTVKE